ncbi:MAG: SDR family oxidoreductase [Calditrichaeota bacterium]|nr:SDR family oxidoreductase [Calditrichota bacterium]
MENKICVVTGANSGIGFALAKGMAQKNFTVVMLCRNKEAGESAKNEIIRSTGNRNIDLMIAELSSQNSIRKFIDGFNAKYERLDVLFNNAGANFFSRQLSEDGIEMTFAVNYLATFLMTNLLLPKLQKSPSGKIITTVGEYHRKGTINFADINFEKNYSPIKTGGQALLAKIIFTYELARRLKNTNIKVNCFHPGAVKTQLQKKLPPLWRILTGMFRPFFLSPEKGAEPGIYLATSEEAENVSGKYFNRFKETRSSKLSYDLETAKRLWELSEEMTGIHTTIGQNN